MSTLKIKAVICDMDGLLIDTERLALNCWLEAARQKGYTLPKQAIIDTIGLDATNSEPIFRSYAPDGFDFESTRLLKNDLMTTHMYEHGAPEKSGAKTSLHLLKEAGYPLAVATSTEETMGKRKLKSAGLYHCFDARVYGTDIKRGKPEPDIFLEAAKQLGIAPEHCVVLEDSPAGLRAAKAAGMLSILIPDLKEADNDMKDNADYIFTDIITAARFIIEAI